MTNPLAAALLAKIKAHDALIGIIGMGYVGLPLALAFVEKGFPVLGFDVDPEKVAKLNRGEGYIQHLDHGRIAAARATGKLEATADFSRLAEADAVLICVPTPLTPQREPDMTYVDAAAHQIRATLRPGQLIVLESTTYPGTTDERLRSILESDTSPSVILRSEATKDLPELAMPMPLQARACPERSEEPVLSRAKERDLPQLGMTSPAEGATKDLIVSGAPPAASSESLSLESRLSRHPEEPPLSCHPEEPRQSCHPEEARRRRADEGSPDIATAHPICGLDFFLAFSPEREDPGRKDFTTTTTPKVVGGVDETSGDLAQALYDQIIAATVRVSSARAAEATKLMENIFRAVNIALVNELKVVYDKMGIDIWEVLDAAATKPFGFMRFNPGPGWGGHCIPLDPFYLAWKAREVGVSTKFIELAGEVNVNMPRYVVEKLQRALNDRGKPVKGSKVLILGIAYKKDIDDDRESPAYEIIELLEALGAEVSYHDPHVPRIPQTRRHAAKAGLASLPLTEATIAAHDAVVLITDHRAVDYALVAKHASLIVDTRGILRDVATVVRA